MVIAQTLYGETGGRYEYNDWQDGMQGVASVISNRVNAPGFPDNYKSVCTQQAQFNRYYRGRTAYLNGSCDGIMWDFAVSMAWSMVNNECVMHPLLNSQYLYFHSERYGNPDRILTIKNKPETIILGGNMFYINYD